MVETRTKKNNNKRQEEEDRCQYMSFLLPNILAESSHLLNELLLGRIQDNLSLVWPWSLIQKATHKNS